RATLRAAASVPGGWSRVVWAVGSALPPLVALKPRRRRAGVARADRAGRGGDRGRRRRGGGGGAGGRAAGVLQELGHGGVGVALSGEQDLLPALAQPGVEAWLAGAVDDPVALDGPVDRQGDGG